MKELWRRLRKRLAPFGDMTALVMAATGSATLFVFDRPTLLTIIPWMIVSMIMAAHSVVLTRLFLPQLDLSEWVRQAREGSVPAALVIVAISFLLGAVFVGVVLWSKA